MKTRRNQIEELLPEEIRETDEGIVCLAQREAFPEEFNSPK